MALGWFVLTKMFVAFILTASFGIHAFYQHKQEANRVISPRKWMFWLYSMIFLIASAANFTKFIVSLAYTQHSAASFHLGYATFLLIISYTMLIAGTKRKEIF